MSKRKHDETDLGVAIRLALGRIDGLVMWRNNVGVASYPDAMGRPVIVRYGLAKGSADLVGCYHGRFVAIEVKTPSGQVRPEQDRWLECVRKSGGFACVVRSVDDALDAIDRAGKGLDR